MEAARNTFAEIPEIVLDFPGRGRPARRIAERKKFAFNKFCAILMILTVAAFANVYQKALIAQNGIDQAKLENRIAEQERTSRELKVKVMLLESPSRLERLAVKELDMVKPEKINYIKIRESETTVKTQKAQNRTEETILSPLVADIGELMSTVMIWAE